MNEHVSLEKINPNVKIDTYIRVKPPEVYKLPFDMQEELSDFDINYTNNSSNIKRG